MDGTANVILFDSLLLLLDVTFSTDGMIVYTHIVNDVWF